MSMQCSIWTSSNTQEKSEGIRIKRETEVSGFVPRHSLSGHLMANELSVDSAIPLKTPEIIKDKFVGSKLTGGTSPLVLSSTATSSQLASGSSKISSTAVPGRAVSNTKRGTGRWPSRDTPTTPAVRAWVTRPTQRAKASSRPCRRETNCFCSDSVCLNLASNLDMFGAVCNIDICIQPEIQEQWGSNSKSFKIKNGCFANGSSTCSWQCLHL